MKIQKIMLVIMAMLCILLLSSCNESNDKIDEIKTKAPTSAQTTIVNDNLANDQFSPRY